MTHTKEQLWERFKKQYYEFPTAGLALDLSRMRFPDDFFETMSAPMARAFAAMAKLEQGGIANPDEGRRVGHYWLRAPELAPDAEIRQQIEKMIESVKAFAAAVHEGRIQGVAGPFRSLLVIGIGGSALGPQFVARALGNPVTDRMETFFLDNTDPDGIHQVLGMLGARLGQTLCIVISKSGGTKETRNGMRETQAAYERAGLSFAEHAVAISGAGSQLDAEATRDGWLSRFPMWDWVGGRTSETSAVGLLPAALQGIDIERLLEGAKTCDEATRHQQIRSNPAALLACMCFFIGKGQGTKDMVVLPYKDRLELFSRYLQQLIMESLGKELDLDGRPVHQGLTVYGNKGSTDQHAYVQQLRDGLANFFVVFIEVLGDLTDPASKQVAVDEDIVSGDYLHGFLRGTRAALYEKDRESITITLDRVSSFGIGVLIALFERAVGLYASLININPYHQPGVEAGKKAAEAVLKLQRQVLGYLRDKHGHALSSAQIASGIGAHGEYEEVFKICQHLAANERIKANPSQESPFAVTYQIPDGP